jgi:hypothetical protein
MMPTQSSILRQIARKCSVVAALAMSFSARCQCPRGICVRHDADPVINPSADRAEVLRFGRVMPARLLDARLERRQLQPQRGIAAYAVRSSLVKRLGKRPFHLISARMDTCLRRGGANRTLPPSDLAKIFGDAQGLQREDHLCFVHALAHFLCAPSNGAVADSARAGQSRSRAKVSGRSGRQ